jgi:hypothetical protein
VLGAGVPLDILVSGDKVETLHLIPVLTVEILLLVAEAAAAADQEAVAAQLEISAELLAAE